MLCESRWSLKVNNNVGDLVKTCPLSNNIFIKIWVTQLDIHTVAPLGIFIRGLMWPISKWWVHIYYHWYLFYVPRGCTPKGHFFKKFNKRIGVNLLQRWPPNAIENRKWLKTFFSRNGRLLRLKRNPSCKIGNLLAKKLQRKRTLQSNIAEIDRRDSCQK